MKKLRIVPADTAINFIGRRFIVFAFSAALVMGSLGISFTNGLNLGIDFLGGILLEVKTADAKADIGKLRSDLGALGLGEVSLQEFGSPDVVLIRVQRQEGGDKAQQAAITVIRDALGAQISEYRRAETVGPTVGAELQESAMYAIGSAILAILVYIGFRFEWQFGVAAIIALIHDVLTTIGLFALFQLEFNLATVAAVLTIAGYSINDTVVVFDRVRENLRKYKKMPLTELFNLSINETLSRTTITSLTTLLALGALFVFGGEVISGFSIALIWGIVIGTYSSIALAVPVLLYLDIDRGTGDENPAESLEAAG
ncbi:MAG: protein translocase subunit SecF [Alphaproteobacteria bacterium]|nr:protein translocase subunit SecF [Alphaproteobacteria bacterium]